MGRLGHVDSTVETNNECEILCGRSLKNRQLEDSVKICVRRTVYVDGEDTELMVLTEGHVGLRALVLAVLNLLIVTASWVYFEHAHNILLACR